MMKENIGRTDEMIRVVIGAAILTAGVAIRSPWGLLGLLPLVTGTMAWSPLYLLLGIDTTGGNRGSAASG